MPRALPRVVLIHWNAAEAAGRLEQLRAAGYDAAHFLPGSGVALAQLADMEPAAVVIDLTRLPAQGRAVGIEIRKRKATRVMPLVFAGGEPEKVHATCRLMPDAFYADWPRIRSALKSALKNSPAVPIVPGTMDGYSGTPLEKKLGIKDGSGVALLGSAPGIPARIKAFATDAGAAEVVLLFAGSHRELGALFQEAAATLAPKGRMWIAWPKKASGRATDLDQLSVRAYGLERGYVDFKICSIDETWSGLCFVPRRDRPTGGVGGGLKRPSSRSRSPERT